MRLSDYDGKYFKVVRDGIFEALALVQKKDIGSVLSFASSENFLRMACSNPNITCIICPESLADSAQLLDTDKGIAICEMPKKAFILLHNDLVQNCQEYNIQYNATQIGAGCKIHPMASIADRGVIIGNNVIVEEFAVIREGCQIGDNVIIRAGAIIGAENYDLCWDDNGRIIKMKQVGQTCLADNVEIGNHALIFKAPFPYERTTIGENTCIDGMVFISHNCHVGSNCFIARSHICGSVIIEDGVRINPMSTVKNAITIGKNAVVSLGSVVVRNVPEGTTVTGNFAIEHSKFLADHLQKLRNK